MKNFFSLFVLLAIISCAPTPEKPSLPEDYWGEASAQRNGMPWKANPACYISPRNQTNIIVSIDSFIENYYLKESLVIADIPPFIGTYPVKNFRIDENILHSVLSMWESDFPLGEYRILDSDSNTNRVTLLSYDTLSKEITGAFNLSFLVSHQPYLSSPDTIRFTNGFFHGRLRE
jgi:hypothetical protein